jgi:hypothetical protein
VDLEASFEKNGYFSKIKVNKTVPKAKTSAVDAENGPVFLLISGALYCYVPISKVLKTLPYSEA